jgi:hypothetical protein
MTHLQRSSLAVTGASSVIEERSPSVERPPCGPSRWRYNCEVRSTSPSVSIMPRRLRLLGHPRTREIYLLEFRVNDTRNGRRARRNFSGCLRPGLVSVQSVDQCLRHALKGSCHPDNIASCYLFQSKNLLASLGVRPLRRGCGWRCLASSASAPSSASAAFSNHHYPCAHNQLDQQH